MTTAIADPMKTFCDLFDANWVAGNTSRITPRFSTGDWDHGRKGGPGVFVFDHDEVPIATGPSTYAFMRGDGSGPGQLRLGQVWVACTAYRWPRKAGTPPAWASVNPKEMAWQLVRECMRIVHAQFVAQAAALAAYESVGSGQVTLAVKDDASPALFSRQFPVVYTRIEDP